jgi:hypothetical protein
MPVIRERFDQVLAGPRLMRSAGPVYLTSARHGMGERISMPLSDDGSRCDGIFGATLYSLDRAGSREQAIGRDLANETVDFFDIS